MTNKSPKTRLSSRNVGKKRPQAAADPWLYLVFVKAGITKQLFHTQISNYNNTLSVDKDPKTLLKTYTNKDLTLELVESKRSRRILFVSKNKTSKRFVTFTRGVLSYIDSSKVLVKIPPDKARVNRVTFEKTATDKQMLKCFNDIVKLVEKTYGISSN